MRQEHLAMMSVPKQKWKPITGPAQALRQGTVFEDLNLPFFVTADQSEGQNSPLDDQLRDSIMANLEKSVQQKQKNGLMKRIKKKNKHKSSACTVTSYYRHFHAKAPSLFIVTFISGRRVGDVLR